MSFPSSALRLALIVAASLWTLGCGNSVPGGGPLVHSTALPSVQGSYTGSTPAQLGGPVTFTISGTNLSGNLAFDFANAIAAPPASFRVDESISGSYSTATTSADIAGNSAYFVVATGEAGGDDYTGVINFNSDHTFTITLHVISDRTWYVGSVRHDNTWIFDIVYTGQRNPTS